MSKVSIGDILKVVRQDETEIDHGCEGPVVNIQMLTDGTIAYTLQVEVDCPNSETPCTTLSQVRNGEYEQIKNLGQELIPLDCVEFEK